MRRLKIDFGILIRRRKGIFTAETTLSERKVNEFDAKTKKLFFGDLAKNWFKENFNWNFSKRKEAGTKPFLFLFDRFLPLLKKLSPYDVNSNFITFPWTPPRGTIYEDVANEQNA